VSDVQLENGYTRIANEILGQLAKTKLNGTQFRILLTVFRYTYGFQRKEHDLSISFISKATDVHRKQIQREIVVLIERKFINVISEATFSKPRIITFNKNYKEWLESEQGTYSLPPNEKDTQTGNELDTSTGNELAPQERKKDNIKESIPLKKESKTFSDSDKEYKLSKYLSKCIAERLDKPLKDEKTLQSWAKEFNKMVRLDKYDYDEMLEVLQFSQTDDFWKKNILSAAKFRKQYLTLLAQMKG
jgi:phage replication O-like protein O